MRVGAVKGRCRWLSVPDVWVCVWVRCRADIAGCQYRTFGSACGCGEGQMSLAVSTGRLGLRVGAVKMSLAVCTGRLGLRVGAVKGRCRWLPAIVWDDRETEQRKQRLPLVEHSSAGPALDLGVGLFHRLWFGVVPPPWVWVCSTALGGMQPCCVYCC
eukprot:365509-Chlamydomonas_euryale.AAC.4